MNAAEVVKTLINVGVTGKDAYTTYLSNGGVAGWQTFLNSDDYQQIQGKLQTLVAGLNGADVQAAIQRIQSKKAALRSGRALAALGPDELHQFNALLDAESVLVLQELRHPTSEFPAFLNVAVNRVLPTLVSVAKVVIPLLL